jgi:hypothetical protein
MDIVTVAPAMDYLIPLTQVLPGCKIVFGDFDLSSVNTKALLGNDKALTEVLGLTDNADNRAKARKIAQGLIASQ